MQRSIATAFVLCSLAACRSAGAPTSTTPATQTYVVEGRVKHVGVRPFEDDLTVFEAVNSAGPLPTSDWEHVKLTRTTETPPLVFVLDLAVMMKTGDSSNNVQVQPGDVIVVPALAGS
jgi:protein involved in polysaccharide export with SLBB domain